ncbi:TIGR00341 family protein [Tateyamaria pelophila]|uniref:TIGR00341 family protein n=1 Tax=Tateyamaria pelophila TaxID=328415 RepID=UPI001CBADCFA|nr:TIGR00341 family protein [Tateyamaria pelophila]
MDIVFVQRFEVVPQRVVDIDLAAMATVDDHPSTTELKQAIHAHPDLSVGAIEVLKDKAPDVTGTTLRKEECDKGEHSDPGDNPAEIRVLAKAIYADNYASIRKMIIGLVNTYGANVFTAVRGNVLSDQSRELVVERSRLLEFLPCEVIICQGFTEDMAFSRVAVLERTGGNQQAALRLAADLADDNNGLTAFQVNPDIGIDAYPVGERRLDKFLAKLPRLKKQSIKRCVSVDDNLQQAIRQLWKESAYDLLVIPATSLRPEHSVGLRLGLNIPVAITVSASPFSSQTRQIVKDTLRQRVPQIAHAERVELVERVQSNAEWNFDFVALMVLSASIAALGLIQNSAAVVIGAMLVAPLMTPIVGFGLALVQGNLMLTKMSAHALLRGVLVAVLAGLVIGLLSWNFNEPTRELFARARPGRLDIAVAFLSGLAAAYAQTRSNLIAALPGVAIAAALVPPIVASGLFLSLAEFELALGAFVLFTINMVAIVLASMVALYAVGIRNRKKLRWPVRVIAVLIAAFTALLFWSSTNTYDVDIAKDIPAGIEQAIEQILGPNYALEDITIAYDELGYQLNLDVRGKEPVPPDLAKAVRLKAAEFYAEASRIRLITRISAEYF